MYCSNLDEIEENVVKKFLNIDIRMSDLYIKMYSIRGTFVRMKKWNSFSITEDDLSEIYMKGLIK